MKITQTHLYRFLSMTETVEDPAVLAARELVRREVRRRKNAGRKVTVHTEQAKKDRERQRKHRAKLREGA